MLETSGEGGSIRGIRTAAAQCLFGLSAFISAAGLSAANPIPIPWGGVPVGTPAEGILRLFLINFPVDMLLFSALFLLVFWKLKDPTRALPNGANALVAKIVACGVVIAVTGALIDFYVFYTYYEYTSYGGTYGGYYAHQIMGLSRLVGAAAGVFASVCVVSVAIAGLRLRPSLMVAAAMTAFNFVAWLMWDYGMLVEDGEAVILLAGAMFLLVPPVLYGIMRVHKRREVLR